MKQGGVKMNAFETAALCIGLSLGTAAVLLTRWRIESRRPYAQRKSFESHRGGAQE